MPSSLIQWHQNHLLAINRQYVIKKEKNVKQNVWTRPLARLNGKDVCFLANVKNKLVHLNESIDWNNKIYMISVLDSSKHTLFNVNIINFDAEFQQNNISSIQTSHGCCFNNNTIIIFVGKWFDLKFEPTNRELKWFWVSNDFAIYELWWMNRIFKENIKPNLN